MNCPKLIDCFHDFYIAFSIALKNIQAPAR